jgi:diguanylate cyclase (GGDEF)-like protein/PAS domain S-box-containing protein
MGSSVSHLSAAISPEAATPIAPHRGALHAALDAIPHPIWIAGAQGDDTYGNAAWREFTGRPLPENDWLQSLHPDDRPSATRLWQQSLGSGQMFRSEWRLRHHSGAYRWLRLEARFQKSASDPAGHWFLSGTDIHEHVLAQRKLARSVQMQKNMLDGSIDCIKLLLPDGTLVHMNQSGCSALGIDPDSGFGQRWLPLLPKEVHGKGRKALQQAVQGSNARFAGMSIIPGQPTIHWDNLLTPLKDVQERVTGILCVSRNVTLQREAERRLRQTSEQDELTGLPNRRAFNKQLKRALAGQRPERGLLGMMLIDLDHFKHVNDTLGHPAGDHLLRVLSRRLQQCLPESGFMARLGGDEFALFVPGLADTAALEAVAQKLLTQAQAPITYAGKLINGGLSIGAALYPSDAQNAPALMKAADTALNDIKASGRGSLRMFNARMQQLAGQVAAQLERARAIVREDAIIPHYQPKVLLADRRLIGFEALLRWHDSAGAIQTPDTVVAAFKDYELATHIHDTMCAKVFSDIAAWQRQGLTVLPVSLNAAPVEFLRDDYAERLLEKLRAHALEPDLIEIEITEHVLTERGAGYVIRALHLLKAAGVRIALDDFGTGHSSLTHLCDYPVDSLKLSGDFIERIGHDATILAVVKAIGQLGPNLSLDTVAEGVETEEQRHILLEAGYRCGQGHLFGQAVDAAAVALKLAVQGLPLRATCVM